MQDFVDIGIGKPVRSDDEYRWDATPFAALYGKFCFPTAFRAIVGVGAGELLIFHIGLHHLPEVMLSGFSDQGFRG